ncbi:MAG: HAMP domain-containing sensor histidine kinase [bacterium]
MGIVIFVSGNLIFGVLLPFFFGITDYLNIANYSTLFLLAFTAYAIVKKNLFNIKTVLATFLVGLPAIVLAVDTLVFTSTATFRILKIVVLSIFLWLGYSLIQNVKKEIERRKVLEGLTKELKIKTKNLKILNKDLKETLEAKQNFLTVASHQLRTPTSVIKGMLSMIIDNSAPDKKDDFIQRCFVQSEHLANTIHDLLSSTAIEGKGFELNRSLTNIDELIAKIVEDKTTELEESNKKREKNVELVYNQPKTPTPPLNIDSNKIGEVIANLIDNAIQYTIKGKIEITTKTDGKNFIFTIKDTGIGIAKEDMPKLFKKIARLDNAISICPDGTGLGLFIIKGMVEKHGGRVEVKSDGRDKGSEFIFWLPVKQ